MGNPVKFLPNPKPDGDVVDVCERALAAARKGLIRSVVITAVNQIHECETEAAGDLGSTRSTILIGGLARAAHKLLTDNKN